jgi:hypothetical protein
VNTTSGKTSQGRWILHAMGSSTDTSAYAWQCARDALRLLKDRVCYRFEYAETLLQGRYIVPPRYHPSI